MRILKTIPALPVLRSAVFIYPTETCYGLGCDATQIKLVARVYQIKGRDWHKPVSWLVKDIAQAKFFVEFSSAAQALADKFWPGPLTLVLPIKLAQQAKLPYLTTGTLALRVSSHPLAQELVGKIDGPLVATSANLSGMSECYTAPAVIDQWRFKPNRPDFLLDGGSLEVCPPSTIVRVIKNEITVLRQGAVQV